MEEYLMRKRVVVTGLGCITPAGNDVNSTWENLINGVSTAGPVTRFDASEYRTKIAAEVKDFDPAEVFGVKEARRMDRFTQFGLFAAIEAVEDANLQINDDNRDRIGALIGSGVGGIETIQNQYSILKSRGHSRVNPFFVPMIISDAAGSMTAIHFGIKGPNFSIATACATGTNTIGEAAELIRRGQAYVMLAGGAEAAIVESAFAGMCSMKAMTTRNDEPFKASSPFDKNRNGFLMGEGAAVLVLESLEHAKERGANILAEVIGYGSTNDAFHISAPSEGGAGAINCMKMALENGDLQPEQIGYINAHGTSTNLNDKIETQAIKTVFGDFAYDIPVSSTKSMTGHLMGASGALEALILVKTLQDNILPPTINYEMPDPECDLDYVPNSSRNKENQYVMSNSFGFGGHNATIIMGKYPPEKSK
jgi:3-oxoacyl-[acyl-carrier-protein] synthase II